jgi:hypothetical protein
VLQEIQSGTDVQVSNLPIRKLRVVRKNADQPSIFNVKDSCNAQKVIFKDLF